MAQIALSDFVLRQTETSEFTHWEIPDEELLSLVLANFDQAKPGYRDGVVLVPIRPDGFYSPVVILKEGDRLVGEYKARRPGETPRKSVQAATGGRKSPAVGVDVVLYRHDVLMEGGEASTDAEWEVISVNARITEEDQPIQPNTLIANHFQLDGGTATKMSPEEFEAALRESVLYWQDKAMLGVSG